MLIRGICIVAGSAIAAANWDGNINYGSPSLSHAPLGINTEKVKRRMRQKRDGSYHHASNVKFTHGVASVRDLNRCSEARANYSRVTHILTPSYYGLELLPWSRTTDRT